MKKNNQNEKIVIKVDTTLENMNLFLSNNDEDKENNIRRNRNKTSMHLFDQRHSIKLKTAVNDKNVINSGPTEFNNQSNAGRQPLTDINFKFGKTLLSRIIEKVTPQKESTKLKESDQSEEDKSIYIDPSKHANAECNAMFHNTLTEKKELPAIANDSLPISLSRLIEKPNIIDSTTLSNMPDIKNITFNRYYADVYFNDSLHEQCIEDDGLFFDISDESNDDTKESNKINYDKEPNKDMSSLLFNIPQRNDFTPINNNAPNIYKGIKQIRKNCEDNILSEDTRSNKPYSSIEKELCALYNINKDCPKINLNEDQINNILKNTRKLSISRSSGSTLSPMVDLRNAGKCKQYKNYYIHSTKGAVNLDVQENTVLHDVLYSTTYLNYIVKNLLHKEYKYTLSKNFLKKYSITDLNRSIVVNWLIKLQTYMRTEHMVIYSAVRMMDQVIDTNDIPLNMLQLVALASFWISLKYHVVDHKQISWMVKQSSGAYSSHQLGVMEKTVFKANNFDVNAIDFSTFIHYYVLKLELTNADIIAQCSHYLLDCSLLDSRFVHTLPSMMAAATVFTSLHLMKQYKDELWFKLCIHCGYYPPDELLLVKNNLIRVLKEVNNPSFQCREPYYKYCSSRYCGVAHMVLDALLIGD